MKILITGKVPYIPKEQHIIMLIADFIKEDNRINHLGMDLEMRGPGIIGSKIARTLAHLSIIEAHKELDMPIIIEALPFIRAYVDDLLNMPILEDNPLPKADRHRIIEPIKSNQPKYSRNEPCYCGSGKKYKRCHGI